MPFDCATATVGIDPQQHYRNCNDAVNGANAVYTANPPFQMGTTENATYDMFSFVLQQASWGFRAAWNFIEADGDAPHYNPDWLAELSVTCAENIVPLYNQLNGRMSNDPTTGTIFYNIAAFLADFCDPYNEGLPPIVNPFPAPVAN